LKNASDIGSFYIDILYIVDIIKIRVILYPQIKKGEIFREVC